MTEKCQPTPLFKISPTTKNVGTNDFAVNHESKSISSNDIYGFQYTLFTLKDCYLSVKINKTVNFYQMKYHNMSEKYVDDYQNQPTKKYKRGMEEYHSTHITKIIASKWY